MHARKCGFTLVGVNALLVICLSFLFCGRSYCQVDDIQHKKEKNISLISNKKLAISHAQISFENLLSEVTDQAGINIFVEDTPRFDVLPVQYSGSLNKGLDYIAEKFDYEWSISKNGSILLTKKFKRKDEFPQMNLAESKQLSLEMQTVLSIMPFRRDSIDDFAHRMRVFYRSLNQNQVDSLAKGNRLQWDDLDDTQKIYLDKSLKSIYFYDIWRSWGIYDRSLRLLPKSELILNQINSQYVGLLVDYHVNNYDLDKFGLRYWLKPLDTQKPKTHKKVN